MPIKPETKNWTWVVGAPCPECGADMSAITVDEVADLIRENAGLWRGVLTGDRVTERPSDDRWSTLEYACHVRDVFRLYDERLHLMLSEDDPTFPDWDQDEAAVSGAYNAQDPETVAGEIEAAAAVVAESFDAVTGEQWQRPGTRSDGSRFSIDTFARYMIHDPVHHIWDVTVSRAHRSI